MERERDLEERGVRVRFLLRDTERRREGDLLLLIERLFDRDRCLEVDLFLRLFDWDLDRRDDRDDWDDDLERRVLTRDFPFPCFGVGDLDPDCELEEDLLRA